MTKKTAVTIQQMIEAADKQKGLVSLMAKTLRVDPSTISRYRKRYPTLERAIQDARSAMLDFTEGKLFENIREGKEASIFFYLKTQGKERGYIERTDITTKDQPVNTEVRQQQNVIIVQSGECRDVLEKLAVNGAMPGTMPPPIALLQDSVKSNGNNGKHKRGNGKHP